MFIFICLFSLFFFGVNGVIITLTYLCIILCGLLYCVVVLSVSLNQEYDYEICLPTKRTDYFMHAFANASIPNSQFSERALNTCVISCDGHNCNGLSTTLRIQILARCKWGKERSLSFLFFSLAVFVLRLSVGCVFCSSIYECLISTMITKSKANYIQIKWINYTLSYWYTKGQQKKNLSQ